MPEPSELPTWSSDGGSRVKPSPSAILTGWLYGQRPPPKWMNWLLGMLCDWIAWHDERIDEVEEDADWAVHAAIWRGQFSGTDTTGALAMATLSQVGTAGTTDNRPELVDFDSGGTPQTDKCLRIPPWSRVDIDFDVLVSYTGVHTSAGYSDLVVQRATSDDFTENLSSVWLSRQWKPDFGGSGTVIRHQMRKSFSTGTSAQYLRFLMQSPASETYEFSPDCNNIEARWVARLLG